MPELGWTRPWPKVFELAPALPGDAWTLIGGLMVQAHARAHGITVIRPTEDLVPISVPDELGALVLKSAAHLSDSRDTDRHLADAAALAACISDYPAERARLGGSDRRRLLHVAKQLANPTHAAWLALPVEQRQAGRDTLRILTN